MTGPEGPVEAAGPEAAVAVRHSGGNGSPIPSGPRREYQWLEIRRAYVEGVKDAEGIIQWKTLAQIAEEIGGNPSRVREHAAKEGWVEQRRQYQARVERTRQQARAAAMTKAAVDLDGKALDASKVGLAVCQWRLKQIAQQREVQGVDALEQKRLAEAIDLWHKVGLRAVGDPAVTKVELSGPGGGPIEIAQELRRDDPDRLSKVLGVLQQAGLGELFSREQIVEAEVLEDGEVLDDDVRLV